MGGHPIDEALRSPTRKGIGSQRFKVFRIPFMQREKAAYAILRRNGLSYQVIAKAFGRSVSVVYNAIQKIVKRYHQLSGYWNARRRFLFDLRKLPYRARMRLASFRRARMFELLSLWEAWIAGEGDKPP